MDDKRRGLAEEIAFYINGEVYDFVRKKELPTWDDVKKAGGVVLTGSTSGVYEEKDWIEKEKQFIRELADKQIPTLGICFGHQIINSAFGGEVIEGQNRQANLVKIELSEDPLFKGVKEVVPVLHNDFVVSKGESMDIIATADYYSIFATRHKEAPMWTVQFHPEFTPKIKHLGKGWEENKLSFENSNATKTLKNFKSITNKCRENYSLKKEK